MRLSLLAAVAVVGAALLAGQATPAPAAFPGRNGKIAFVSHGKLFLIDPTTKSVEPLPAGGYVNGPSWSPDGKRIAYASGQIGIVNADGSGDKTVTDVSADGDPFAPAWSPNGKRIAFAFEGFKDTLDVVNADGSHHRVLVTGPAGGAAKQPSWSPNGRSIAFTFVHDLTISDVYLVDPATKKMRALTTDHRSSDPAWSPNGRRIVYRSIANGNSELYVMNADGTGRRRLTSGGGNFSPAWSPNGRKIVFVRGHYVQNPSEAVTGRGSLYTMNPDGTGVTLLHRATYDLSPDWQPL